MVKKKDLNCFTVTNAKGEEVTYEILFTFESKDTDKKYMVYTENEKDEDGMIKTYASIYEEDEDNVIKLTKIEDEAEWNLVEKLLKQATEEVESQDK